jgi:membrane-associated phospholipid phosphatase
MTADTGGMGWDRSLLAALAAHRPGGVTAVAKGLMEAGQPATTYVAAAIAALVFAWVYGAWRSVAAAMLASVVATGVAEFTKELIARARPPASLALVPADGFAMPSSIAALTAGAATPLLLWGLRSGRRSAQVIVVLLAVGTVLVGASMVYLGAHWLSDVLAGWVLGAAVGVAALRLLEGGPSALQRWVRPSGRTRT